ncbi:CHASE domain-containing protein [Cesiribacter andamanensis]|uniref:histidine kinase n=1 Tax=Cesiribacter andamanensis AMV16 TaxID=1279009 RepID=M7N4R9_9BACT|nr:CHASE domain-containing protein [Cesiribacter andamanensis]EMR02221.1 Phytochrome-like protein cph1 [Cesiribacter andamanensis AMV16]
MSLSKVREFFRVYALAVVAFVVLLILTFITFWQTYSRVLERNEALFTLRTETAKSAIEKRMNDYIQILKGAKGLFMIADSVSRQEWKEYVAMVEVDANYPGIQGLGYSAYFPKSYLPALEAQLRAGGFPDFAVWPAGDREVYTSILYLEPFDRRNQRAFGYDMYTDSVRREAMERARDTGQPSLSGILTLVQETETGVQRGLNLYVPLYKRNAPLETQEQRRQHLTGFIYSPFRVNDLMSGILGNRFKELHLEVYEGSRLDRSSLVYDSDTIAHANRKHQDVLRISPIRLAGRTWQVYSSPGPEFGQGTALPWFILGGGMLMSSLIFIILYSLTNSRRSNYLKQLITDNATAALFILDKHQRCTFINPAARALVGYSLDDYKRTGFHELVHHSRLDGSPFPAADCPIVKALAQTGVIYNHESVFFRSDGSYVHVLLNAQPIVDANTVVAYLLEAHDISQRKEAELALKEKNKNLQLLNTIGRDLSAELDLKKLLQSVTDSCTELTNAEFGALFYHQDNGQGEKLTLHTLSGAGSEVVQDMAIAGLLGQEVVCSDDITQDPLFGKDTPYQGIDTSKLPVKSYLAVPVKSRGGELLGALLFGHRRAGVFTTTSIEVVQGIASQAAIAIDNSRLFETIRQKNDELHKINNDLDNFVYTASHDLKSPVLNIEGLVYALQAALKRNKPERVEEILEKIQLSIAKFKETIQALTEVARTNKNLHEDVEVFDLRELLNDVLLSIEDSILKSEARLHTDLVCSKMHFSRASMSSILQNLITNSIKYRSPERAPEIHIACARKDGGVELLISDNGLGIAQEHLSKIYTMFRRYHTHVEGTGIGLYLVKRIVDNHGGSIAVQSEVNRGTTFSIYLPQ